MALDKQGPIFVKKNIESISDVFRVCNVFAFYINSTRLSFAFMF